MQKKRERLRSRHFLFGHASTSKYFCEAEKEALKERICESVFRAQEKGATAKQAFPFRACFIISRFLLSGKQQEQKDSVNCSSEKYEQTNSLKVLRLKTFTSIPYFSFLYYLVSLIGYRTRYRNTLFNHAVVPLL